MRLNFFYDQRFRCLMLITLLISLIVYSGNTLYAHWPGQSYIYIKKYDNKLTGRFEITLSDLNKDLKTTSTRGPISEANLEDRINEVYDYYIKKVQFYDGTRNLPIRFTGSDIMKTKFATFALLNFIIIENSVGPDAIDIDYSVMFDTDPDHLALLVIEKFWKAGIFSNENRVSLTFSPENRRQQLSFSDYSVFKGFVGVVKLGIKHIWKGIDHILFLIALILPSAMRRHSNHWEPVTKFRSAIIYVVKIVTLFTIAHSVTLSIAALGIFSLPARIVEPIIAASIAVAALDIIIPIFKRKIGWVVFIFGLFSWLWICERAGQAWRSGRAHGTFSFWFQLGRRDWADCRYRYYISADLLFKAIYFLSKNNYALWCCGNDFCGCLLVFRTRLF